MDYSTLNDHGCFLLSNGSISQGLDFLKQALSAFEAGSTRRPSNRWHGNPTSTQTARYAHAHYRVPSFHHLLLSCAAREILDLLQPLLLCESIERSSSSDVFTVSFNLALAAHLQGLQHSNNGEMDAAHKSLVVALQMYNLTLHQSVQGNGTDCAPVNTRNDLIFGAVFNNLAHVYAALGQYDYARAAAEQLLKALFFLVDSGRVASCEEMQAHDSLMKNACLLTMNTHTTASAA